MYMHELGDYLLSLDYQLIISYILIIIGSFFVISGAIGIIRFPDFYSRMHPAGLIDSAGAPLILVGCAVQYGISFTSFKIIILIAFLLFTGSTSTHILSKAAMLTGLKPYGKVDDSDK